MSQKSYPSQDILTAYDFAVFHFCFAKDKKNSQKVKRG